MPCGGERKTLDIHLSFRSAAGGYIGQITSIFIKWQLTDHYLEGQISDRVFKSDQKAHCKDMTWEIGWCELLELFVNVVVQVKQIQELLKTLTSNTVSSNFAANTFGNRSTILIFRPHFMHLVFQH